MGRGSESGGVVVNAVAGVWMVWGAGRGRGCIGGVAREFWIDAELSLDGWGIECGVGDDGPI